MKNFFTRLSLMAVLTALLMPVVAMAQENPMLAPLPVDSGTIVGKLPNGLTYYIRHNETPKGQADFYIAQNVGSALEEDNQRGLAHFLEHMCFNGTTNFPDNTLREWLESVGVKFGYNLNAYTSIDETVYNISNVPTARESVQDSCLLILHDWADDLTLAPAEIDKERGVIHEEWRRSMQGQMRILEKILPDLFPTTKYGHRLPIGTMEVVDNFPYQALRDYYEKWYRPDQQAIIVVGDIDPARIEGKIKELFSSIKMPENAAERTFEPVPDHQGTLYGIGSDPEMHNLMGAISFLSDPMPKEMKNTRAYQMQDYIMDLITTMLNNRYNEISSKPDAPFAFAGSNFGEFIVAKTKDAFDINVAAKDKDIVAPLQAAYREALRAQRGGFTPGEYDRARQELLAKYEKAYNNRNSAENESYVKSYVRNYVDGTPIDGIASKYQFLQQMAPMIPVQAVNEAMKQLITSDNRAVMVLSPEGDGYTLPTKEALAAAFAAVDAEDIAPFVDEMKSEPLIPEEPKAGTIVSETHNTQWDATEWTLSNGAKVIVKPTKFKDDEILFDAYANGGFIGYPADYTATLVALPYLIGNNGLGSYTNTDLQKYTAGKEVRVSLSLDAYSREVEGSSTPKDLPTFMELLYMTFRDLQFTAEEFEALQKAFAGVLANQEKQPQYIFQKDLSQAFYTSPLRQPVSAEIINNASREQLIKVAHDATANAADFTFTFVGNVDPAVLKPLVEKYIASLPGDVKTAKTGPVTEFDPAYFIKKGTGTDTFTTPMTTPQTYVAIFETGNAPYTAKEAKMASIAGQVLTNRLLKTVREDMGAVYSIGAQGRQSRQSPNNLSLLTVFPMKPEMKAEVLDFINGQFKAMESDITAEEVNPAKEFMIKNVGEDLEKNDQWINGISGWLVNGVDTFNGAVETIQSITVDDIKDYMKRLNAQGNYRTVILEAEAAPAE